MHKTFGFIDISRRNLMARYFATALLVALGFAPPGRAGTWLFYYVNDSGCDAHIYEEIRIYGGIYTGIIASAGDVGVAAHSTLLDGSEGGADLDGQGTVYTL